MYTYSSPPDPPPPIWRTFIEGHLINSQQDEGVFRLWLLHVSPHPPHLSPPPFLTYYPGGGSLQVSMTPSLFHNIPHLSSPWKHRRVELCISSQMELNFAAQTVRMEYSVGWGWCGRPAFLWCQRHTLQLGVKIILGMYLTQWWTTFTTPSCSRKRFSPEQPCEDCWPIAFDWVRPIWLCGCVSVFQIRWSLRAHMKQYTSKRGTQKETWGSALCPFEI